MVPAEATEFPSGQGAKKASGATFLLIGAAAAILFGGAFAVLMRGKPDEPPVSAQPPAIPSAGTSLPAVPSPPPATPPSAQEPTAAEPAPQPGSSKVLVNVQTDPIGATVLVDGKPACDPTPCSFSLARETLVTVEASKSGYRTAKTDIKALQDPTPVQLVLRRRAAVSSNGPSSGGDDELKLPDAFAPSRRVR